MREYIIIGLIIIISLLFGFIFGRFGLKMHRDGTLVIEMTEDGQRERVRFVIDKDLDELKSKTNIVLKVDNKLSKN